VMEHIAEIERSPWIYRWHAELSYNALRKTEQSPKK